MDLFGGNSTETTQPRMMIRKHDFVPHHWNENNFNWLMEEIVFDFLCLEDDIVEDLCKDFPAQDNYQRYKVAHSFDFDRRKFYELRASEKIACTGVGKWDANSKQRNSFKEAIFGKGNPQYLRYVGNDGGKTKEVIQQDMFNPNNESDKDSIRLSTDIVSASVSTLKDEEREGYYPVILNYELLSEDKNGNQEQIKGMNERMKIKVELLNHSEDASDLSAEKNHEIVEPSESESTTTKIRLKIPNSVINSEEKDGLRNFVISHIKKKYNNPVKMLNDSEIMQFT